LAEDQHQLLKFRFKILLIIALSYTAGFFAFDNWKETMNNGDSSGYYMHLVSSVLNQDVGNYTKTIDDYLENYQKAKDPRKDKYGIRKTDKDRYYIKYTLGVAVMEIPALLIAHSIASISDRHEADGWSQPYAFWINFSKVFYIVIGFLFLIKTLKLYFENKIVAFTVLSIALGTNLFYHGIFLTLAHSFLFFDFCLLIYLSNKFYQNPSNKRALGIGLLVGLITLTRVPEVVGLLIPLLWGVSNIAGLKSRFNFFKNKPSYLLVAAAGLLVAFSPQIFYWHYVSGQFFFNPYQGESFNFLKPNIINGWFNFRNGWLIYTPIMIFALIGFFFMKREKIKGALIPALLFLSLISWIHYSYYIWNYYPGMGSRPMIECYPILAFPLAAFFSRFHHGPKSKWIISVLTVFFIALNIFQCWQMKKGIIYTQNGSSAFYLETFGQTTSSITSLQCYDVKRAQAKIEELKFIDTLFVESYENANIPNLDKTISFSGSQSLNTKNSEHISERSINIGDTNLEAYDWVYVSIKALRKQKDMAWERIGLEELFCQLIDENGKKIKSSSIRIAPYIGNENHSIFFSGKTDVWGEAGFYFRISNKVKDDYKLKVFVRNLRKHSLYIDDLTLLHFKSK